MRRPFLVLALLAAGFSGWSARAQTVVAHDDILAGDYDGTFDSVEAVNDLVGAETFYDAGYFGQRTIVANVEAGYVWGGHEVFDRSVLGLPSSPALFVSASPDIGQYDYHATMVGQILAGTGENSDGSLSLLGAGMAPLATLWSGAIATSFSTDPDQIGQFEISDQSFLVPYQTFFEGTNGQKADVINSSWGFDDPAGNAKETVILDALCVENPTVTFVKSAGNGGPTSAPGGPGSGYNGITVGSLGGTTGPNPYLTPSTFSSSKPGDFYNPVTGVTITGVRAAVDISAPGEDFALAYYGGATGSLATQVGAGNPATDLYFVFNQSGTSFSSPVVAGGVSLLKDVSYGGVYLVGLPQARDTRVIKSVLLAGATSTIGWDNGEKVVNGVLTTDQALDYATGAGRLNLDTSVDIYVGGTTDVPGTGGGSIESEGWDLGTVALHGANDYFFDLTLPSETQLSISLNWFVNGTFDSAADDASDTSFADLDLQVWSVTNGVFDSLVAQSDTTYNNTELLRFELLGGGNYGIRVLYKQNIYDVTGTLNSEDYAVAWQAAPEPAPVPEPAAWGVATGLALLFVAVSRRRRLPMLVALR